MTSILLNIDLIILTISSIYLAILSIYSNTNFVSKNKTPLIIIGCIIAIAGLLYAITIKSSIKNQLEVKYLNKISTTYLEIIDGEISLEQAFETLNKTKLPDLNLTDVENVLISKNNVQFAQEKLEDIENQIKERKKKKSTDKQNELIYRKEANYIFSNNKLRNQLKKTIDSLVENIESASNHGIGKQIIKIDDTNYTFPATLGFTVNEHDTDREKNRIILRDNYIKIEYIDGNAIYIYISSGIYKSPIDYMLEGGRKNRFFNYLEYDNLLEHTKYINDDFGLDTFQYFNPYIIIDVGGRHSRTPIGLIIINPNNKLSIYVYQLSRDTKVKPPIYKKWVEDDDKIINKINKIQDEGDKLTKFIFEIIGNMYL